MLRPRQSTRSSKRSKPNGNNNWDPESSASYAAYSRSSTRSPARPTTGPRRRAITDGLDRECARLVALPVDWPERQFRLIGRRDARDLAVVLPGIALLTNTFRDPELMTREARRLERWIDSLA
jgi:hypothetical protein